MTTATEIEKIDGELLVKGKLKLVDTNSTNMVFLKNGKLVSPIIISESELFKNEELVWNVETNKIEMAKSGRPYLFKILALPENFSPDKILDIKDGKIKDGDDIYLACRNDANINDAPIYKIRLNSENHFITVKKKNQ